jgi:hypothetical protein
LVAWHTDIFQLALVVLLDFALDILVLPAIIWRMKDKAMHVGKRSRGDVREVTSLRVGGARRRFGGWRRFHEIVHAWLVPRDGVLAHPAVIILEHRVNSQIVVLVAWRSDIFHLVLVVLLDFALDILVLPAIIGRIKDKAMQVGKHVIRSRNTDCEAWGKDP